MEFISAFETNFWLFISTILIVGLSVGSFLNVVIYRVPVMLKNEWRSECQSFLEIESYEEKTDTTFNLMKPVSSCPSCGHKIRFRENVPLFSYLFLKGQCAKCKTHISLQYPAIEVITAALSVVVAMHFGVTIETVFALLFTWSLISLTMIDAQTQLLPDNITQPLLWLGLLINAFGVITDLQSAVIGAAIGYMVLWSVYKLFKLITGKEGMGYGDFKLLAALGAWMGWQFLPQIILLSSLVGVIIGVSMIIFKRHDKNIPIPFGPYLAIAGWIAFMWGQQINHTWLNI